MATDLKTNAEDGFIRLALAQPFQRHLLRKGHDPAPALHKLGLSTEALSDPSLFVHSDVMYQLLEAWAADAGEPYLGLQVGEAFNFLAWPPVLAAVEGADTLGQFFSNFILHVPKETSAVSHRLVIDGEGAAYVVTRQAAEGVPQHQNTAFGCAFYVRLLMLATGPDWDPSEVSFEARHLKGIPKRYLGIETRRAPDSAIRVRFPTDWVFRPLHLASRIAAKEAETPRPDVSLVVALRAILRPRLDEARIAAEEVADLLGMSPGRLASALRKEDTTLPREIKRLRIEHAKDLLRDPRRTITQIGVTVGYVDKAHFTRFFKSQTGMTPSQYRAEIQKR